MLTFTGIAIFTAIGIAAAAAVWCIQLVSSRKSPERHRTWLAYMPALQVALAVMTVLAGVVAISTQNMVRLQYFVAFEDPHYWDMWGGLNMYLGLILVATGIGYGLLSLPLLITRGLSRWTQLVAFALVAVLDAVVSVIGIWAVMQ